MAPRSQHGHPGGRELTATRGLRLRRRANGLLSAGTPAGRVSLFTSLLSLIAVLCLAREAGWGAPGASIGVSWAAVALGFGACEFFCVHLEFRQDAIALTLSEVPLLIGLMALPPAQVVLAQLLGAGAALVVRRRRGRKLAFNLASFTLEAAAGAAVYHAVLGHSSALSPAGWLAAAGAAAAYNLTNVATVPIAVRLSSGQSQALVWRSIATAGALSLTANTSLALLASTVLAANRWAAGLLALVAGMMYLLTRAHASLRQRYASLQVLYDFTSKVGAALDGEQMLKTMLDEARSVLRAESAELMLFGVGGKRPVRSTVSGAGGLVTTHIANDVDVALEASVVARGMPLVIGAHHGSVEQRSAIASRGYADAVVATLRIDERSMGTLLVGNRLGDISTFDREDCRVFQALANHAAIALENSRLIDQLRREAMQKEYQALHDPLTGLPNRALFNREVDAILAGRGAPSAVVAVMLMDLDRFKDVNDTLGHQLGDVLLQDIGTRLSGALGQLGLVGRLGGDEFGILLRSVADAAAAEALATDLCRSLELPFPLGDLLIEVGASIGIALAPRDGEDGTALLRRADVAMYAAKANGGGVEAYQAHKDRNSPRRLSLLGELRRAIDGDELAVYYQPKADLKTGVIVGAEALVRWNHPHHGLLLPAEFIPMAEQSGLMAPLTRHVLEVATNQCREWLDAGMSLGMSVNLPVRSLLDTGLPDEIERVLQGAGVAPGRLTLEITESTLLMDPPRAIGVLERLAELGVKLSIDDFGTGYSSLSYLKRLPVTELKIDRCFVASMASDPNDAAIVRSTTELGHNLGLNVVAEGVEDWMTWQRLLVNNVDVAQGFVLSRPVPAGELEEWMRHWRPDEVPRMAATGATQGLAKAPPHLTLLTNGRRKPHGRPVVIGPSR
jgi:diguanylate cyclase (GGDEF)-like protein